MKNFLLGFGLLALGACASSTPAADPVASAPANANGAVDATNSAVTCATTEFVAAGVCYPTAEAACATLACTTECLQLETAPVQVRCKE